MTGYRVCLDCDQMIAVDGDHWHKIIDGVLIGCEGYHHTTLESRIKNSQVEEAYGLAQTIKEQFAKDCLEFGHLYSEDYADAFHSIGQLFMEISAQMLHEVYKDDQDASVREHMAMVLRQGTEDGNEARATLVPFLPSIDQI